MKSYTDIEQSKKLAEILSIESADMWWNYYSVTTDFGTPQIIHLDTPWVGSFNWNNEPDNVPCWSVAALLDVLPDEVGDNHYLTLDKEGKEYCCCYEDNNGNSFRHTFADNPVDACVEMIICLHELNLL